MESGSQPDRNEENELEPINADSKVLNEKDAEDLIEKINEGIGHVRRLLFDLHEGRGWEVLGYSDFKECIRERCNFSRAHAYRQLKAARVEQNLIMHELLPGKEIGQVRETVLRPLAGLSNKDQKEVWIRSKNAVKEKKRKKDKDEMPTSTDTYKVTREFLGKGKVEKKSRVDRTFQTISEKWKEDEIRAIMEKLRAKLGEKRGVGQGG